MNSDRGFTLIEVMISMFIMAMLTVLVSSSIRSAVQNKKKLEARIASETMLYDSLRVMKLDIERAFNYQDVFYQIESLAIQQLEAEKSRNKGNQQPAQPLRPQPQKLTQFLGENSSLHFTALNHFRTQYNAQESNQMEVGYFIDDCEKRNGRGNTRCLWRRSNTEIDDKVDQDGPKVVVAENVTKFLLSYRSDKEEDEWVKQWRSDNKGRNDHRNRFPSYIKIEMEINDEDDPRVKKVSQTVVTRVEFPNNEPLMGQTPPAGAGGGAPR